MEDLERERSNRNGWTEWSKFVLKELERLNAVSDNISKEIVKTREEHQKDLSSIKEVLRKDIEENKDEINKEINKFTGDIAGLKVKSGVWGLIGGLIPIFITAIIFVMTQWGNWTSAKHEAAKQLNNDKDIHITAGNYEYYKKVHDEVHEAMNKKQEGVPANGKN